MAGQAISRVAITDPTLMFDTFTLLQESFIVAYCLEFLSRDTIFFKIMALSRVFLALDAFLFFFFPVAYIVYCPVIIYIFSGFWEALSMSK